MLSDEIYKPSFFFISDADPESALIISGILKISTRALRERAGPPRHCAGGGADPVGPS